MQSSTTIFPEFGLSYTNINVAQLTLHEINKLKTKLYQHKLLVFKQQHLSCKNYLLFAKKLGQPQRFKLKNYSLQGHPEIMVLNNQSLGDQDRGGRKIGNMWHTDSSYLSKPLPLTLLYAKKVPNAQGSTLFRDMVQALKMLSPAVREALHNRQALHDVKWTYKITTTDVGSSIHEVVTHLAQRYPAVSHPCLMTHPFNGQQSLYLNPGYTTTVLGYDKTQSDNLLKRVFNSILTPSQIQTYPWEAQDLMIWDNRSLIHCATDLPAHEARLMYRIGVDDGEFFG